MRSLERFPIDPRKGLVGVGVGLVLVGGLGLLSYANQNGYISIPGSGDDGDDIDLSGINHTNVEDEPPGGNTNSAIVFQGGIQSGPLDGPKPTVFPNLPGISLVTPQPGANILQNGAPVEMEQNPGTSMVDLDEWNQLPGFSLLTPEERAQLAVVIQRMSIDDLGDDDSELNDYYTEEQLEGIYQTFRHVVEGRQSAFYKHGLIPENAADLGPLIHFPGYGTNQGTRKTYDELAMMIDIMNQLNNYNQAQEYVDSVAQANTWLEPFIADPTERYYQARQAIAAVEIARMLYPGHTPEELLQLQTTVLDSMIVSKLLAQGLQFNNDTPLYQDDGKAWNVDGNILFLTTLDDIHGMFDVGVPYITVTMTSTSSVQTQGIANHIGRLLAIEKQQPHGTTLPEILVISIIQTNVRDGNNEIVPIMYKYDTDTNSYHIEDITKPQ